MSRFAPRWNGAATFWPMPPIAAAGGEQMSASVPMMTPVTGCNRYDQVPYPSYSFAQSHPDRLATIATLLGLSPAPVRHCRVLELGCAGGGNLIPMAQQLPESQFMGVDLSGRQIAEGQTMIADLGLTNISLKAMNILDVEAGLGRFDYIIAHGVYSWVPPEVQDKILAICRENLAAEGVAYVSYNLYPGWRTLGLVREVLLYHTRHLTDPLAQATEARVFLEFMARWTVTERDSFRGFLHLIVNFVKDRMIPKDDAYLLHDELSPINEPLYFYQFAERVARHGLRYLADAQFQSGLVSNLPSELAEALRQMAEDTIALEQYLDFLQHRAFRQSLLCHQEVTLTARLKPERLAEFYLASSALPDGVPEPEARAAARTAVERAEGEVLPLIRPGAENRVENSGRPSLARFLAPDGAAFTTDHPLTAAAIAYLTEVWPRAIPFLTVVAEAARRTGANESTINRAEVHVMAANLLKAFGYSDDLIEFHAYAPPLTLEVGDLPWASPVARWQARRGTKVVNLRHERVNLNKLSWRLLPFLDGQHNRTALLHLLEGWLANGQLELEKEGRLITNRSEARQALVETLNITLRHLAQAALLMAGGPGSTVRNLS
ncbi:MAG: class I SAM-dependent methyltransferase [Chloroflexota bacterium]